MKQSVTISVKTRVTFNITLPIMARGRIMEASLISSDMCTEQSYPTRTAIGASSPIMEPRPVLDQPPSLVKLRSASAALRRGAVAQSVMTIAKKPEICTTRAMPSVLSQRCLHPHLIPNNLPMSGNFEANTVLNEIVKNTVAIASRVPCQRRYGYV